MSEPGTPAVVTGVGTVSCLGEDAAGLFDALCEGRSGVTRPPEDMLAALRLDAAGLAPPISPTSVLRPAEARLADRFVLMGIAAADQALADAGITVGEDSDPERTAVVIANSSGGLMTFEQQALRCAERGRAGVSPYLLPGELPNMATARVAIRHGIRGHSSTISTACSGGAQAVAEGLRLIRENRADVVVCGGSEAPFSSTMVSAFHNARALAASVEDPTAASRPFDTDRTGFVLSEGAAVLVLESPEHARSRGVGGYCDIMGWSVTTDAYHATAPRPDGAGAEVAMRRALDDAGLDPSSVDYVNAHATATKAGDVAEANVLRRVFGERRPRVSSTKGATGHLLAAAGALEAVICALAVDQGRLPPTLNLDRPDPDCGLNHVVGGAEIRRDPVAVSNSFAFGGHNVSLVFGPTENRRPRSETDRAPAPSALNGA